MSKPDGEAKAMVPLIPSNPASPERSGLSSYHPSMTLPKTRAVDKQRIGIENNLRLCIPRGERKVCHEDGMRTGLRKVYFQLEKSIKEV